jgi:two-component system chemotaxis response regulator CheY
VKLLIVDDSAIIRSRIQRASLGSAWQFEVVGQARNGSEALRLCTEKRPEVITMDLTMPEMDGIECTRRMSALLPKAQILVVSALSDKATALEALKAGAHGFLLKPFSEKELAGALDELMKENRT